MIGCSLAGVAALVTLTVCLYRCRQRSRRPSSNVDAEQGVIGDEALDRGRLSAVQAPPPIPDLCSYTDRESCRCPIVRGVSPPTLERQGRSPMSWTWIASIHGLDWIGLDWIGWEDCDHVSLISNHRSTVDAVSFKL